MTDPREILQQAEAAVCRPWLRHILSPADWATFAQGAAAASWSLLGLWADTVQVHALFLDHESLTVVLVSTAVQNRRYPALSPILPSALYERMIRDLWGHEADGAADLRPWLDHGQWQLAPPMAARPAIPPPGEPPPLAGPDHDDEMILPFGPVWGLIDEVAHLRLILRDSTVRHAEALLGFAHKGALTLMRGKSPRAAARFAARLAADATVSHAVAFAQAAEAAMNIAAPPRAVALRIVMMELERIAVHLDNLGEFARLAGADRLWTQCGRVRETLLRVCESAFGHRLMMDCVVPGGVAMDLPTLAPDQILRVLATITAALPALRRQHEAPAMAARLAGLGHVTPHMITATSTGGLVARASGAATDLRVTFSPGYQDIGPRLITLPSGDAMARQMLRLLEIEDSIRLIGATFELLPSGAQTVSLPLVSGEGIGCAESPRGDVWHWLRLDHGQIATAFARDPAWTLWPLAETTMRHTQPEDIALIRASLALSASGMDL